MIMPMFKVDQRARVMVVFIVLFLLPLSRCESSRNHPLHFSYITTITGGIRAIGGKPVIDLALEEINNRTDILQNYTLNYTTIRNSECTRTGALDAFFQDFPIGSQLLNGTVPDTNFLALLCCGCSPATIPIAEISHYWNIPQIAFAAADEELTDRSKFKGLYRTLPSFEYISVAIAELARTFRWSQMAIISQDETLFTGVNDVLRGLFLDESWILDESALIPSSEDYFTEEGKFPFDTAFSWMSNSDFRIIAINSYAEYAYMILCKAHELGLVPPRYVWITPMWYNREWWKPISDKLSFACTKSQLLQVLSGSIGVVPDGYFTLENDTVTTVSQRSPSMFQKEYKRRLSLPEYDDDLEELGIAGVAYDTVWAIALALNKMNDRVLTGNDRGCENVPGELVPLEEFSYTNQRMGCVLKQCMEDTDFVGITGRIVYDSAGSRPNDVLLVQQYRSSSGILYVRDGVFERVTVAKELVVNETNVKFRFINGEGYSTLWESGVVPYDGSVVKVVHGNSIVLTSVFCLLAAMGLIFTVICLIINIIFRNKKIMKLSSSNLNYLIIAGAALLYVCVGLFASPHSTQNTATIICNLRAWIFSFGYTLCFAVILSKTWRIYYIFNNPTTKKKSIKDWMLIIIIILTVSVDMCIVLVGTAIPSSKLYAVEIKDKKQFTHVTDDGMNQAFYVYGCGSNSMIWIAISFAYKGLLQMVAIFMAFHIRKVKIKVLNDSKETVAIIYINSIILVLMSVATFGLEGYQEAYTALLSIALLVQASLFLGLLFIPKVINLYHDPEGDKVFNVTSDVPCNHQLQTNGVGIAVGSNGTVVGDPYDKMKELREQLRALETKYGKAKDAAKVSD